MGSMGEEVEPSSAQGSESSEPEYVDLFGESTEYEVLEDELNEFRGITADEFEGLPPAAKRALAVARKQLLTKKREDEGRVSQYRTAVEEARRAKEDLLESRALIAQFLNKDTLGTWSKPDDDAPEPDWNDPAYIKHHAMKAANERIDELVEALSKQSLALSQAHEAKKAERTQQARLETLESMFAERGYVQGTPERAELFNAMKAAKAAGVDTSDLKTWMEYSMWRLGWDRPAPPPPPPAQMDEDDEDGDIYEGLEGVELWERLENDEAFAARVMERRNKTRRYLY